MQELNGVCAVLQLPLMAAPAPVVAAAAAGRGFTKHSDMSRVMLWRRRGCSICERGRSQHQQLLQLPVCLSAKPVQKQVVLELCWVKSAATHCGPLLLLEQTGLLLHARV